MAHKVLENGNVVVDWTTGDPEGDRLHLLQAYQDFFKELLHLLNHGKYDIDNEDVINLLNKWSISIDNQVDEVPRIWIKRPTE